jgi:hypothetical protein
VLVVLTISVVDALQPASATHAARSAIHVGHRIAP